MLGMSGNDRREHVTPEVSFGDEAVFQEETSKFAAPATPGPEACRWKAHHQALHLKRILVWQHR